jgi:acyl-CoA thioester hydrolase
MTDIEREKKIVEKLLGIEDFKEIEVRVDDTDLMSVVHFNKYLNYFDDGFVSFTAKLNKHCGELHKEGIVFPVRKVEIEYLQSATFGDKILLHTRVKSVGNTSITFIIDCYKNNKSKDTLLVKGTMVRLIMDMNKNELMKITNFFSDII